MLNDSPKCKNQFESIFKIEGITIEEDEVIYEICPNCSRKFFEGRLRLHLKSCTDKKPFKPTK